jgi:hypothetical protein
MCACVYLYYTCTCIYTCMHTYIHMHITYIYIYIYAYVCMCACICDVYVYTYMCVSVCVCVCVCVDAHTRVDRHKDSPIHSILTCMHVWHIYTGFCAQLLCVLSVFGMEIPTEMFGLQGLKLSLISHRASSDLDEDNLYATMAEYLIRGGSGRTQRVCALWLVTFSVDVNSGTMSLTHAAQHRHVSHRAQNIPFKQQVSSLERWMGVVCPWQESYGVSLAYVVSKVRERIAIL